MEEDNRAFPVPGCLTCFAPLFRTNQEINDMAREAAKEKVLRLLPLPADAHPESHPGVREFFLSQTQLRVFFKQKISLRCGHIFHESCLFTWFKYQWRQHVQDHLNGVVFHAPFRFSCPYCQTKLHLGTDLINTKFLEDPELEDVCRTARCIKKIRRGWTAIKTGFFPFLRNTVSVIPWPSPRLILGICVRIMVVFMLIYIVAWAFYPHDLARYLNQL